MDRFSRSKCAQSTSALRRKSFKSLQVYKFAINMQTLALIAAVVFASILIDAGEATVVITSPAYHGTFIYYGNFQDSERVLEGAKQGAGTARPGPCKACKRGTGTWNSQAPLESGMMASEGRSGRSATPGGGHVGETFYRGEHHVAEGFVEILRAEVQGTKLFVETAKEGIEDGFHDGPDHHDH